MAKRRLRSNQFPPKKSFSYSYLGLNPDRTSLGRNLGLFHGSKYLVGLGLLILGFRGQTQVDTPQSVGLFWTSDRPIAETTP